MEIIIEITTVIVSLFAAYFWFRSAWVKYPEKPEPTFYINKRGNQAMENTDEFFNKQWIFFQDKSAAIQKQSKYNSYAAFASMLVAIIQAFLLIIKHLK